MLSVDPSLDIYLSLTAATGDPDLYASFSSTAPSRSDFQFSATAASEEDGIHIKTSEPGFCPRGTPCSLAVAVFGFSASFFSISAVQQLDGPVALLDGVPLVRCQQRGKALALGLSPLERRWQAHPTTCKAWPPRCPRYCASPPVLCLPTAGHTPPLAPAGLPRLHPPPFPCP